VSHVVVAATHNKTAGHASSTFIGDFHLWYNSHTTGRGIWKWENALTAYQRHLSAMANQPIKLVEIGVQSGGSIQMWQAVLGAQCHVYGIDINAGVNQFADAMTTLTIGDQADHTMWANFYQSTGPVDALIDDGGHEPHQMLITLQDSFDHITPGGALIIEDIHGQNYVDSFFVPTATFLGTKAAQGQLGSVHMYPYVLAAIRGGNDQRAPVLFQGTTATVATFEQMWATLPQHPGGHVILENPGWGPFLTEAGLANFFRIFGPLHDSFWTDNPPGCRTTAQAVCTVTTTNNQMQGLVTGIHIYPTRLIVEVTATPVVIQATRRGDFWLPYGL